MKPQQTSKIKIAIVDDHALFRKGLIALINMFDNEYVVEFEASDGRDFQKKIRLGILPDIVLMDINMPDIDGFESVQWLKENYPTVSVLIISMLEREEIMIRMLKLGVKGYLTKDIDPEELRKALTAVTKQGYYYTDFITGKLIHSIIQDNTIAGGHIPAPKLTDREKEFLKFACTELTYKQIADKMFLSPKTIDGYRDALFEKLNAKSRTGLALYAIRNGMVSL